MENLNRQPKLLRNLLVITLAAGFFLLAAGPGETAGNETREPKEVTSAPPSSAIPVAEVATHEAAAANLIHTLETQLAPSPAIEIIRIRLPKFSGAHRPAA